jgi:hypothetical protein
VIGTATSPHRCGQHHDRAWRAMPEDTPVGGICAEVTEDNLWKLQ